LAAVRDRASRAKNPSIRISASRYRQQFHQGLYIWRRLLLGADQLRLCNRRRAGLHQARFFKTRRNSLTAFRKYIVQLYLLRRDRSRSSRHHWRAGVARRPSAAARGAVAVAARLAVRDRLQPAVFADISTGVRRHL